MHAFKLGLTLGAAMLVSVGVAQAQQTYKVGISGAPFGINDPKTNTSQGYAVEVMNAIAKDAGFQVQFTYVPAFGDLIPGLVAKQIDIDAAATAVTPERKAMGVDFSDAYVGWSECLVVSKDNLTAYKSLDDLKGEVVSASAGTTYLDGLNKMTGFKAVRSFPNVDAAADPIAKGDVKGFLGIGAQLIYRQKQGELSNLRVVNTYVPIYPGFGAIGVRKGETDLLNKINASLAKLKTNGTLKVLAAKWDVQPPA